ncbi:hypothetical protein [Dyadobacter sp. CY312]|uniref:hypothetical protein n=1 Tax=Dyadobacter sp. CY312 TaxID=2907303 RepID=UPI001F45C726|nr:hypothetical protein [Dyadobacter sp. CY312]MCE7042381.1 hypothetical protein [Dyadobacter sp. CY312]
MYPQLFSNELKLVFIETAVYDHSGAVACVRFGFEFVNTEYTVLLSKNNVEKDINFVDAEGDSDLFDAFLHQIEDVHWHEMKNLFSRHEMRENQYVGIS